MTSAVDSAAFSLLQDMKEGIKNGQIADLSTVQAEIDAAMAKLKSERPFGERAHFHDLVEQLFLEISSLNEKVAKCETRLADFQLQATVIKEDTTQIVARTEACGLLVEQQQRENAKVLAAIGATGTSASIAPPASCMAPVQSPTDTVLRHPPARTALISFPGGPRTVTIHPPDSPSYQPVIHDEKGEIIIDFRLTKPLRREGAFRGPLEDIDWHDITRVCGRGPEHAGIPPSSRWPDRSQPPTHRPPRHPSELIAREYQLSRTLHTDTFGRVIPPEYLSVARSPSLPTGTSSSSFCSLALALSPDSQPSSSNGKHERTSRSPPMPPSPSAGRGKKRTRQSDEEGGVPMTLEARSKASQSIDPHATKEAIKREDARPHEEHGTRKRLRSSVALSTPDDTPRTHSSLDPTRTV